MTTFQDLPPQSRRAVRQSERGETSPEVAAEPQPYSFDPISGQSGAGETPVTPATGRCAAQPHLGNQDLLAEGFEPLSYTTQGPRLVHHREVLPGAEHAKPQSLADQAPAAHEPADQAPTTHGPQGYRVRDFSPEGRRAVINRELAEGLAKAAPPPGMTPPIVPTAHAIAPPVDLEYHTQVSASPQHAPVPSASSFTPRSHSAAVPVSEDDVMNHTLTRRELRELRAGQEEPHPLQMPESIDTLLNSGPIDLPVLSVVPGQSQALAQAMAEFDMLTRVRREAEAKAQLDAVAAISHVESLEPVQLPATAASIPAAFLASAPAPATAPVPLAPPVSESVTESLALSESPSDPEALPAPESLSEPDVAQTYSAPPPTTAPQNIYPPALMLPLAAPRWDEPEPAAPAVDTERAPSTKPVGHWSVQAELDDEEQALEATQSRTVGGGSVAVTTSALVLPSVPQATDITSPFTATGEIMITGTIDLPMSLSSTGAHPHRVDNSDFDDDPLDHEFVSADSAPVRAIRAISTHTSTRGVIDTRRLQRNRLPTVMIIATCVLAVAVAALLVVAAVQHLF